MTKAEEAGALVRRLKHYLNFNEHDVDPVTRQFTLTARGIAPKFSGSMRRPALPLKPLDRSSACLRR